MYSLKNVSLIGKTYTERVNIQSERILKLDLPEYVESNNDKSIFNKNNIFKDVNNKYNDIIINEIDISILTFYFSLSEDIILINKYGLCKNDNKNIFNENNNQVLHIQNMFEVLTNRELLDYLKNHLIENNNNNNNNNNNKSQDSYLELNKKIDLINYFLSFDESQIIYVKKNMINLYYFIYINNPTESKDILFLIEAYNNNNYNFLEYINILTNYSLKLQDNNTFEIYVYKFILIKNYFISLNYSNLINELTILDNIINSNNKSNKVDLIGKLTTILDKIQLIFKEYKLNYSFYYNNNISLNKVLNEYLNTLNKEYNLEVLYQDLENLNLAFLNYLYNNKDSDIINNEHVLKQLASGFNSVFSLIINIIFNNNIFNLEDYFNENSILKEITPFFSIDSYYYNNNNLFLLKQEKAFIENNDVIINSDNYFIYFIFNYYLFNKEKSHQFFINFKQLIDVVQYNKYLELKEDNNLYSMYNHFNEIPILLNIKSFDNDINYKNNNFLTFFSSFFLIYINVNNVICNNNDKNNCNDENERYFKSYYDILINSYFYYFRMIDDYSYLSFIPLIKHFLFSDYNNINTIVYLTEDNNICFINKISYLIKEINRIYTIIDHSIESNSCNEYTINNIYNLCNCYNDITNFVFLTIGKFKNIESIYLYDIRMLIKLIKSFLVFHNSPLFYKIKKINTNQLKDLKQVYNLMIDANFNNITNLLIHIESCHHSIKQNLSGKTDVLFFVLISVYIMLPILHDNNKVLFKTRKISNQSNLNEDQNNNSKELEIKNEYSLGVGNLSNFDINENVDLKEMVEEMYLSDNKSFNTISYNSFKENNNDNNTSSSSSSSGNSNSYLNKDFNYLNSSNHFYNSIIELNKYNNAYNVGNIDEVINTSDISKFIELNNEIESKYKYFTTYKFIKFYKITYIVEDILNNLKNEYSKLNSISKDNTEYNKNNINENINLLIEKFRHYVRILFIRSDTTYRNNQYFLNCIYLPSFIKYLNNCSYIFGNNLFDNELVCLIVNESKDICFNKVNFDIKEKHRLSLLLNFRDYEINDLDKYFDYQLLINKLKDSQLNCFSYLYSYFKKEISIFDINNNSFYKTNSSPVLWKYLTLNKSF